jgi:hypothetical protein
MPILKTLLVDHLEHFLTCKYPSRIVIRETCNASVYQLFDFRTVYAVRSKRGLPICRATVVIGPGPAASDSSRESLRPARIKQQQHESLKTSWREMENWDNNCSLYFW